MHYIDNQSVRFECVNGLAANHLTQDLVTVVLQQEEELKSLSWFARVPSAGNPADTPSRPELPLLALLAARGRRIQPASLALWGGRAFLDG